MALHLNQRVLLQSMPECSVFILVRCVLGKRIKGIEEKCFDWFCYWFSRTAEKSNFANVHNVQLKTCSVYIISSWIFILCNCEFCINLITNIEWLLYTLSTFLHNRMIWIHTHSHAWWEHINYVLTDRMFIVQLRKQNSVLGLRGGWRNLLWLQPGVSQNGQI